MSQKKKIIRPKTTLVDEPDKSNNLKGTFKTVRLTDDMLRLFKLIADEKGVSVCKYLRDAGVIVAEMTTEEKELLELLHDKDKLKAQKTFHFLIKESKESVLKSISGLFESFSNRMNRLEKLTELLLYFYLYHTPEVKDSSKKKAMLSAQTRKKKIMALLEKELLKS